MIWDIEYRDEPDVLCTLASMCIDLAMADSGSAKSAIADARGALTDVRTSRAANSLEGGRYAVTANLMLADVDSWQTAARGNALPNNYQQFLERSMQVRSLAETDRRARAALAEGIPLLLGLRRHERTGGAGGWLGRLSLFREDQRDGRTNGQGKNRSWDVAASDNGVVSFVNPDRRIQVKLGSITKEVATRYRQGGVIPMSAQELGFGRPEHIVSSCAYESSNGTTGAPYLSSTRLDTLTDGLEAALAKGAPA